MGNTPSNQETYSVATAIPLDTHVVTAYAVEDNKSPSAPPMSNDMIRDDLIRQLNMVVPELGVNFARGTRFGAMELDAMNNIKIFANNVDSEPLAPDEPNYATLNSSYERGLRDGIDRCSITLVLAMLSSGQLDKLGILVRELDYVNQCMSKKKHNIKRQEIKDLIEERIYFVLRNN